MNAQTTFLIASLAVHCLTGSIAIAAQPVQVEVDAAKTGRAINPWLYGINTAKWDESLFPGPTHEMLLTADRDAIEKIKASRVTVLKYPGGNEADRYIWNASTNLASEMDTDEYIALCRAVGAEPFITINFNESPELAAEWVRYCNKVKDYNVKLWEVGDEQWGWWAKGHAPPEVYAEKYIAFVKAMRAVDPDIKVATNVPLGHHPQNWTERVLKAAGDYVDMITFTFFPQQTFEESDEKLLASTAKYREQFTKLRQDVERVLGRERMEKILFVNVGYNSVNHSPGPQTIQVINAIWTADMLGAMAETGTDIGCFWALHNYYPPRDGDYGYLSSEGSNTPRPSYYVFPMFVNHFGDTVVASSWNDPDLSIYSSRTETNVAIFAINKNSQTAKPIEIAVRNFQGKPAAQAWILDEFRKYEPLPEITAQIRRTPPGVPQRTLRAGGDHAPLQLALELPPYSLVAINWIQEDVVLPPRNLARNATALASSHSVIGPHFGPESAIDGLDYTRWQSAAWLKSDGKEEQWLMLTWKTPQKVSRVRLHWGEAAGVDYLLEASKNGTDWQTLRHVTNGTGGLKEFTFEPVELRYLRMNGREGRNVQATKGISVYSIREFEVFGE